jgi:adenine-specific DNA-methyltransferase
LPTWADALLQEPVVDTTHYVSAAPFEHRRRFGQYFTPPRIAAWMADWVVQPTTRSVLDPAVGTGALLDAVLAHPVVASDAALAGHDVDPVILAVCRERLAGLARTLNLTPGDFLHDLARTRYDAIVCNPPYIRHRALPERAELYERFDQEYDLKLNRFSNSYVLFLLKIARTLSDHGRAAVITPVDFLNANFGRPIKEFLLREKLLDGLLVFGHTTLVFDDANVAACIVLLRADRQPEAPLTLAYVPSETELAPLPQLPAPWQRSIRPTELTPEAKWLAYVPNPRAQPTWAPLPRMVPLGQLAAVRRGIATGANEFFTLTAAERTRFGLEAECRLCITKAMHAPQLDFTADDVDLLLKDHKKLYLLDVTSDPSLAAQDYLAAGVRRGIHHRYLARHRQPWYAAEQRPAAPLWATTFTRRAFRFVLNAASIANLTAFHAVYPHEVDHEHLWLLAAFLNSACAAALLTQQQRSYGSGLMKLEPLDLASLPVPDPATIPSTLRAEITTLYAARCAAARAGSPDAARHSVAIDQLWQQVLQSDAA